MQYKGDLGKFRKALAITGFKDKSTDIMFNDNSKTHRDRRLKLWFATEVVFASLERQQALFSQLQKEFGERLLEVYSIPLPRYIRPGRSLCIRLKE